MGSLVNSCHAEMLVAVHVQSYTTYVILPTFLSNVLPRNLTLLCSQCIPLFCHTGIERWVAIGDCIVSQHGESEDDKQNSH